MLSRVQSLPSHGTLALFTELLFSHDSADKLELIVRAIVLEIENKFVIPLVVHHVYTTSLNPKLDIFCSTIPY